MKLIALLALVCAIVYFRGMKTMGEDNIDNQKRRGQMTVVLHGSTSTAVASAKGERAK